MTPPHIVVFGGSGFLGCHICRAALQRQCLVTSISRSGGNQQHDRLTIVKADIFSPEQYRTSLQGATAVIYSAGMLLEGEYKSIARGEFELSKVLSLLRQLKSRNPLEADPQLPRGYNALNRDGAILVAREAVSAGVPSFTYISAAANFPAVPRRYISSKREAESAISKLGGLRSIFIRPGLMFSSRDRPHLAPIKGIISGIAEINSRLGGKLPFIGAAGVEPLDVEIVARATVAATLDENAAGVIDVNTLARLGT